MMLFEKKRRAGLIVAALFGVALLAPIARGQDAAWEGLIDAGRNALQQQDYSEAERHFEAALETAERFPSGDARLGKSYNNLAAVYYAQEDFERAEPLMRRALAELQETLGPNDSEVAQTMKNLAALYYLQGNRREAEDLLKRSLAILEEVHGPNHAFVATILSNLAGLYQAEDRFQDAEPLLTRSLEIWENLLGSDHPDVVRSRSLLAQVRQAQGGGGARETAAADGTAAAEPAASPRSLTPLAAESGAATAPSEASDELARAATAVEELTRLSKAEAGAASSNAVPAPALNPIGALDAAAGAVEEWERKAPVPAIAVPTAASDPTTGQESDDAPVPQPIIDAAIGTALTEQDETTAVLNKATSPADDVSFAIYLSTLWSVEEARRYWRALQDAMPAILGDKQLEIEEIAAGDGADPFYRVLTKPFLSDPEAQATCEQIRTQLRTHDCSVVVRDNPEATAGG